MNGSAARLELRQLVARAEQLASDIDAAHTVLRAAGDVPTQRAGFRLPDAAGQVRQVVGDLEATAADLDYLAGRAASACPAEWGVCPEHGGTLRGSGGRSWCVEPGCGRTWDYDRDGRPCEEPVVFEVRGLGDQPEQWAPLCVGHTKTARDQIEGVQVRALIIDQTG